MQTFRFGHGSFFSLLCRRRLHDVSRGALSQMALTLHSTFVAKTISILVLLHAARLAPAITRLRHGPHFCNGRLARLRRFYGTDKLSEVISILGRALRHRLLVRVELHFRDAHPKLRPKGMAFGGVGVHDLGLRVAF